MELSRDQAARFGNARLGEKAAILIEEVEPGSLAERSGLIRGDVILQVGGSAMTDLGTWAAVAAQGGQTRLSILRGEQILEIEVNLQAPQ
jgi:S1-C subfamily serine protease